MDRDGQTWTDGQGRMDMSGGSLGVVWGWSGGVLGWSGGGLGVVWGWSGGGLGLPPEFPRWRNRHTRCMCIHLLFGRTDKRTDGIVKIGDKRTDGRTNERTNGQGVCRSRIYQ